LNTAKVTAGPGQDVTTYLGFMYFVHLRAAWP